jgi:hypothetical protein
MALLVPNIGEQESLRYLVNHSQNTPRNLILKLLSNASSSAWGGPAESDSPTSLITATYKEPYTYATGTGADNSATPYGYPLCDAPYANQRGILLDGANWTVTPVMGTAHSSLDTNTASYPEQTFTFTAGSVYIHGYYVARANSIAQNFLNNTTSAATIVSSTYAPTTGAATSTATTNILGVKILAMAPTGTSSSVGAQAAGQGAYNSSSISIGSTLSSPIAVGDYVTGTGVGPYARVTAITGATTTTAIAVSTPCTGTVSGALTFYPGGIAYGQTVSGTGINSGAKVVGYDPTTGYVTLDLAHTATVTGTMTFSYLQVSATAHGALPGDVVYIARGSGNTTMTEGSYIVNTVAANTFTTIPALDGTTTNSVILYDSIMFLEKFTHGPYYIQNNGDQIKITLNVSLA